MQAMTPKPGIHGYRHHQTMKFPPFVPGCH